MNFTLDGLTPRRSHVRRGDHMYPRAITSCPGHALCLTWQVKCTCSGDHIRAWCQELQYHAKRCNSWHQARMWSPLHVHLTQQVRHRACPGQDVIARGYMWSPRRTCDRRGVRPSRLKLGSTTIPIPTPTHHSNPLFYTAKVVYRGILVSLVQSQKMGPFLKISAKL